MKNKQIESEIRFLKSENMRELIHEADIESCHDDCDFINKRIKKLQRKLNQPEKVDFRKSTKKICWIGKQPKLRKVPERGD